MTRIIDIHHHVGDVGPLAGLAAAVNPSERMEADIAVRLAYMDANGIDEAVIMPSNGGPAPRGFEDRRADNDRIAAYRDANRSRFIAALGTVDPKDQDLALREIDRCVTELGLAGIVWHHRFLGIPINHPFMDTLLDRVQTHQVPAFVHVIAESTFESPWRLEALAQRHREVTFVALDGFSGVSNAQWMIHLAKNNENILFDTGVLISVAHMLAEFVDTVGADRLLLGTDFYSTPQLFCSPFPIGELNAMELSEAQLEAICSDNARRLLRL